MKIDYDFSNVALLPKEKTDLKMVKAIGSVSPDKIYNCDDICNFGFLEYDDFQKVHTTEKYDRYILWRRLQFIRSVLVPFVISLLTSIATILLPKLLL